jgi:hypothetical protein
VTISEINQLYENGTSLSEAELYAFAEFFLNNTDKQIANSDGEFTYSVFWYCPLKKKSHLEYIVAIDIVAALEKALPLHMDVNNAITFKGVLPENLKYHQEEN